ncbi:DNA-binding protein [Microbulbifer celer]|uniref:DNA-binding protein n=1 Tax=Microbulbifer celer TaxID=435905 RepID=A0ABW3U705_9GAMM|nr:DNA-binding protein [Microbulbifer celer]UFN58824.1 DNA-binding protein [Microbulbifer celer]
MARTGVGYIDIVNAAEALKERGEEPTVDRVRTELGTGSKSTIAPLLKRWRAEAEGANVDTGGLPRELVDALKSLYESVQAQSAQEIQQAREECEEAVGNLERELAQVKSTLSERTQSLENVEQKLQASTEEGEELQRQLNQVRSALEKSEYQREEGSARIVELKAAVSELKAENRDVREHFEHYQQRTAEDRQQERDQARLAAEQARSQMANLSDQLALTNRKLTESEAQLELERQRIRELDGERQHWQERDSAHKSEIKALKGRQADLQRQLEEKTTELASAQDKVSALQMSHASAMREAELREAAASKLEAELHAARERLESIQDENRLILQEKAVLQGQFTQLERSLNTAEAD